jgi:hypothetical protein
MGTIISIARLISSVFIITTAGAIVSIVIQDARKARRKR